MKEKFENDANSRVSDSENRSGSFEILPELKANNSSESLHFDNSQVGVVNKRRAEKTVNKSTLFKAKNSINLQEDDHSATKKSCCTLF